MRGLAYMALRQYAEHKVDGGFSAAVRALGDDPFAHYYQQLFIAAGDYDASPLMRMFQELSRRAGREIGSFIAARSRASAVRDSTGMWKPLLKNSTPHAMAERLPLAFNRYFEPCAASVEDHESKSFTGTLKHVPECMSGLYCESTNGFVSACLELAGASGASVDWLSREPSGALSGVAVATWRFRARWS
ncbi:MAG TPA: hypothetical protein PKD61_06460 [Polyangiaceae bacterium]|nr:hypothetical protein [Polyangiaceae bacterium]